MARLIHPQEERKIAAEQMTAAIRMDDGALSLWQNSNRLIQHGIDQSGIGAAADCPVHNQTIETVDERREIEFTGAIPNSV